MIRYRIRIETPYAGQDYEEEVEFDEEPTEADLDDALATAYSNAFPASYERIDDDEETE